MSPSGQLPNRPLALVASAIVSCQRCQRLRSYCERIAVERRAAYRDQEYWGKPVPGFGDPRARLLVLGLAPAAHGANRTGRVFTGDGVGGSGDFLIAALNRAGFANINTSTHRDDGLVLNDAYIIAAVRCAPPDNKPLPDEILACADHLDAELAALPHLEVVVALGKIAWDAWFQSLTRHGAGIRPRPAFGHGVAIEFARTFNRPESPSVRRRRLRGGSQGAMTVIDCYHPSRQNTNTGKVTPTMYDDVFRRVNQVLHGRL